MKLSISWPRTQRGAALLTALLIMTIVVTLTTAIAFRQQLDIRQTRLLINGDQLHNTSSYGLSWAKAVLLTQANLTDPLLPTDTLPQSQTLPSLMGIGGQAKLIDAQGRFNLNNLQDALPTDQTLSPETNAGDDAEEEPNDAPSEDSSENTDEDNTNSSTGDITEREVAATETDALDEFSPAAQLFITLLQRVDTEMDQDAAIRITQAITLWLSPDDALRVGMDSHYLEQNPPYVSSGQPFVSISELKLVDGITPKLYRQLQPYVTALPEVTPINVNAAPPLILAVLLAPLSENEATQLAKRLQNQGGYASVDDFLSAEAPTKKNAYATLMTTQSEYFTLYTAAEHEGQRFNTTRLLHRQLPKPQGSEIPPPEPESEATATEPKANPEKEANAEETEAPQVTVLWTIFSY